MDVYSRGSLQPEIRGQSEAPLTGWGVLGITASGDRCMRRSPQQITLLPGGLDRSKGWTPPERVTSYLPCGHFCLCQKCLY